MMNDTDATNHHLKEKFSSDVFTGRQIFRLVYSENITEHRYGNFTDTDANGNLIRRVTEVREVKKYPYLKDTWILEKLVWIGGENPELPKARGYEYECIWAFVDRSGNPLYPHYYIVEIIIQTLLSGNVPKRTEADLLDEDEKKKEKEAAEYFAILEDEGRSNLFAWNDSVFIDSTKKLEIEDKGNV
jgi:hypothetical protein